MSIRLGSYLVRHGSGFKFQMAVPRDLRKIVGRRMWRRYLPRMDEREARLTALQLALECRREIDRLRVLARGLGAVRVEPDGADFGGRHWRLTGGRGHQPASLAGQLPGSGRYGGPGEQGSPPTMVGGTIGALQAWASNDNVGVEGRVSGPDQLQTRPGLASQDLRDRSDAGLSTGPFRIELPAPAGPVAAAESGSAGILDLVALWRRIARPRAVRSVLRMQTCAKLLIEVIGPMEALQIGRSEIMRFRDHLETTTLSRATARLYLQGIHRLFSVALSEGAIRENPAAGILLRPGTDKFADRDRRRPFQPRELRAIFDALAREPEAFQWIVRLLAYHGMRSGEVVQLRVEDVVPLFGVPVLRVHDRHGSIKNRFSQRDVPLHPACAGFLAYVQSLRGPRIFEESLWRADRFQHKAGAFLRRRVDLDDPTVTMHSLRHTWRTLAREVGMPAAVSRAIMGHSMGSDVHEGYGAGPSLRLKAEWMARIDPFASELTN